MENKGLNDQMPMDKPRDFLGDPKVDNINHLTILPIHEEIKKVDRDNVEAINSENNDAN